MGQYTSLEQQVADELSQQQGGSGSSTSGVVYAADHGFSTSNTGAQNVAALTAARDAAGLAAVASQGAGVVEVAAGTFPLSQMSMIASNGYSVRLKCAGKNATFLGPMPDSGAGTYLLDWGATAPTRRCTVAEGFTLYGPGISMVVGTLPANCDGIRIPPGCDIVSVDVERCNANIVLVDDHHLVFDCRGGGGWYGLGVASNGNLGNCTYINCDFTSNARASVGLIAAGGTRGYKAYGFSTTRPQPAATAPGRTAPRTAWRASH